MIALIYRFAQANEQQSDDRSASADLERALESTRHELAEVSRLALERVRELDSLKAQVDSLVSRMDSLHSRSEEAAARLDELVSAPRPPESAAEANASGTYEELQRQLGAFEQTELIPLSSEAETLAQVARVMTELPSVEEGAVSSGDGGHRRRTVLGADSVRALENELAEINQLIDQVAQQHATRCEQVEVELLRTGAFQHTFQSVLKWLADIEKSVNEQTPVGSFSIIVLH